MAHVALGIGLQPRADVHDVAVGDDVLLAFEAVTVSATEAVFENPRHDFPQRVIYSKTDAGLTARIEGTMNGKSRGVDFLYARCQ